LPLSVQFLKDLKKNNSKSWFEKNWEILSFKIKIPPPQGGGIGEDMIYFF
jgi:hypothetical protein